MNGKWSISADQESYFGLYETAAAAIEEGKTWGVDRFWVAQCVSPVPPEELFDESCIDHWLEHCVFGHDDYAGEWAENEVQATCAQQQELASLIQPVIAEWLDRHDLRPKHVNIDPVSVVMIDCKDKE